MIKGLGDKKGGQVFIWLLARDRIEAVDGDLVFGVLTHIFNRTNRFFSPVDVWVPQPYPGIEKRLGIG